MFDAPGRVLPVTRPAGRAGPVIERDHELGVLAGLIAATVRERGSVAVVEGPSGIGKTRLALEATRTAERDGVRVLRARGDELERDYPFGLVRQLFEPALASAGGHERTRLLGDAAGLAEAVIGGDPIRAAGSDPSHAVLHGLYWLTANFAREGPLVLSLDDVQWIDAPSARWLGFLARRLDGLGVHVLLGLRSPGADGGRDGLADILTHPTTTILRPPVLSREGAAALIARYTGVQPEDGFSERCHLLTGGNPFLLGALADELAANGVAPVAASVDELGRLRPVAVERTVLGRLARLGAPAAAVAEAVAILGPGPPPDRVAALAGLRTAQVLDAVRGLAETGVFAEGEELGFAHSLLAEAVAGRLGAAERARRHARAAELMRAEGASPDAIAGQILQADPEGLGWRRELLRTAAQRAVRRGAPDTATTYLRRALREEADADAGLLLELGALEARQMRPEGVPRLREALAASDDSSSRAPVALELAWGLTAAGEIPAAVAVLERQLEDVDPTHARRLEVELIGSAWMDVRTRPEASARLSALTPPRRVETVEDAALLANFAQDAVMAGTSAAAASELATRAIAGPWPDSAENSGVFWMAVNTLTFADHFAAAGKAIERAMARARRDGSALQHAIAASYRALLAFRRGAIDDAVGDARQALGVDPLLRSALNRPAASAFLAYALVERGDLDEAESVLDDLDPGLWESASFMVNSLLLARGRLRLAAGNPHAALGDLRACGQRLADWGVVNPAMLPWRSAVAEALHAIGDADEARALAREEVGLTRRWGAPRALGLALRIAGAVTEDGAGLELLREAVAVLAESPARLERAHALVGLGVALRARGGSVEAREPLRGGLALAHECGARALAGRAHAELLASGARPRRTAVSGRDALTPSERRVVALAAEGGTNREIAQGLFLTEKTIETHLHSAFRKLGITSRASLSQALAG